MWTRTHAHTNTHTHTHTHTHTQHTHTHTHTHTHRCTHITNAFALNTHTIMYWDINIVINTNLLTIPVHTTSTVFAWFGSLIFISITIHTTENKPDSRLEYKSDLEYTEHTLNANTSRVDRIMIKIIGILETLAELEAGHCSKLCCIQMQHKVSATLNNKMQNKKNKKRNVVKGNK